MTTTKRLFRVAIVHDALLYKGGAERVLWVLLRKFPSADVYTSFFAPSLRDEVQHLTGGRVFVSPFDRLPLARRFADWFKLPLFYYWESLDLSSYDLIISSSHSFSAKSIMAPAGTVHISYVHTSPRYLYDEYNETRWIRNPVVQTLLRPVFSWMRRKDYAAAQRPNILTANSKTVQQRIKRYYDRDSVVIYPPIRTPPKAVLNDRKPTYFLCVSRLVKQKGIDLAVRTCATLNLPLVVVGVGPQEKYLRSISGPTVKFLGFISDDKMANVYCKARALLYCARDEDFGMVPAEAMAHGVPVIAYNSGGVRETVIDRKTGVLFDDHTVESFIGAVKSFESLRFSKKFLLAHARQFSEERFMREFRRTVDRSFQDRHKQ